MKEKEIKELTPEQINHTQQKAVATTTGKAEKVTIRVNRITWRHRFGLLPKKKEFALKPIVAGNLQRVSALLLKIEINTENTNEGDWKKSLELMSAHIDEVIEICAIALHGVRGEPPEELIEFLNDNANMTILPTIVLKVAMSLNVTGFMTSITLINKVSLMKSGSLIARGE